MNDGIICIDKPAEHTSFDVIARMRGILHTKKLGHAGTLDPMATGVLPIFVGRATKACDILPVQEKRYTARMKLGVTTDTQDCTGQVLSTAPVTCTMEEFRQAILSFRGEISQLPPMYSAVQVGGQRLYDLAREGREVEREPRQITIHRLDILELTETEAVLDVACSKGTYIRTICHDIGQKLGCGGILTELRRTEAAGFDLSRCITLDELTRLAQEGRAEEVLLPVESLFESLRRVYLSEGAARLYRNGVRLDWRRLRLKPDGKDVAVYDQNGLFLGVSWLDEETGDLNTRKLFAL